MQFTVAAAETVSLPGDISGNVAHHLRFAAVAAEHEVQLLVFPELSLTGYELTLAAANAITPNDSRLEPMRRFAAAARMVLVAGAPVLNDRGDLHIGALAFHPDGSVVTYAKEHVHRSELHVFTSGPGGPPLAVGNRTVALAICADAKHPSHAAAAARRGADVYAVGAMITEEEYPPKAALMGGYAGEHGMAVLLSNYAGVTGGSASAGKSALWSDNGTQVAVSSGTGEALVVGTKAGDSWTGTVLSFPSRVQAG